MSLSKIPARLLKDPDSVPPPPVVPAWNVSEYKKYNDQIAQHYGEPGNPLRRMVEQVRRLVRSADALKDPRARIDALTVAITLIVNELERAL